jgi:DNA repair exonuclease SbcCD nuclease subunit
MDLIRKYCFGDHEIKVKIVSDQEKNFVSGKVNYEDPNFNIQHPIFSIHGNHDDPSGVRCPNFFFFFFGSSTFSESTSKVYLIMDTRHFAEILLVSLIRYFLCGNTSRVFFFFELTRMGLPHHRRSYIVANRLPSLFP